MNALTKYFETKAAHKTISDRRWARRDELGSTREAEKDPNFKALDAQATRLYLEAEALTPHVIRANLDRMGVNDLTVIGVLHYSDDKPIPGGIEFRDGKEAGRVEMLVSDLCGLGYSGVANRLGIESRKLSFYIVVEQDGKEIGYVDSDGRFRYKAAPDFRSALGWQIATDGGRVSLIENFNLDEASEMVLSTIRVNGVEQNAFFDPYFAALSRVFVAGHTSRFGDGYCGAAITLWRVATRQLGEEHRGYSFSY